MLAPQVTTSLGRGARHRRYDWQDTRCILSFVDQWQKGSVVVGIFLAGCSNFVEANGSGPASTNSGTSATEGTSSGSTSGASTTGSAEGSGGGSADDTATTTDTPSTSTSSSDPSSTDGPAESSESTASLEGSAFEASYTGTFTAVCEIAIAGTLSIDVDTDGNISGTASASGQSVDVTGTVDGLGAVDGDSSLEGLGECDLIGTIAAGSLIGNGSFNCPSAPVRCSGTWALFGI